MTRKQKTMADFMATAFALLIGSLLILAVGRYIGQILHENQLSERLSQVGASYSRLAASEVSGIEIVREGTIIHINQAIEDDAFASLKDDIHSCDDLYLDLSNSQLTDAGLQVLKNATQIKALDLTGTFVTDDGLAVVGTMENLVLLYAPIQTTEVGLAHLGKLKKLRVLGLTHTKVTDSGLEQLHGLQRLRRITVGWGAVTPEGAAALQLAIPNAEVRRVGPPFDDPIEDRRVTEDTGKALPVDGGPWVEVCRRYFAALHDKDIYTLKSSWSRKVDVSFKNIDDEVLAIRPTSIVRFRGYQTSEAATVSVQGPCQEFGMVTYDIHLVWEDNQWRINHLHMVIDGEPW